MDLAKTKKNILRRGALAALASALLIAGLGSPASAVPDDGNGEVIVSVVDFAGKPLKASVGFLEAGVGSTGGPSGASASTITESLPAGSYGLVGMAPWAGIFCAGVTPCSYYNLVGAGTSTTVSGVLTVTDTETPTTYTFHAPAPAVITGGNTVGQVRTITFSPEMMNLGTLTAAYGGVTVQWLRNGTPIANATAMTYALTKDDVGRTIAARLSYTPTMQSLWGTMGAVAEPIVLTGRPVLKAKTKTTVEVFRSTITAGRSSGFRADVTSGRSPATGKVRIVIGTLKITKTLRNGSIRGVLPKSLKAGKYTITATYLGSGSFLGSKGKDKLTVKPATT